MGGVVRCERCLKGLSKTEKWVVMDEALYHSKCAERLEKGRR